MTFFDNWRTEAAFRGLYNEQLESYIGKLETEYEIASNTRKEEIFKEYWKSLTAKVIETLVEQTQTNKQSFKWA